MSAPWRGFGVSHVVGIESRGFIVGSPVAARIHAGFVPVRKAGKLPWRTVEQSYALEYGTDTLEVHADAVGPGDRVLVIDDVLATGGTGAATISLIRNLGAEVVGFGVLVGTSRPYHGNDSYPGTPASAIVGMSGAAPERVAVVTAIARKRPDLTCGIAAAIGANIMSVSPPITAATP